MQKGFLSQKRRLREAPLLTLFTRAGCELAFQRPRALRSDPRSLHPRKSTSVRRTHQHAGVQRKGGLRRLSAEKGGKTHSTTKRVGPLFLAADASDSQRVFSAYSFESARANFLRPAKSFKTTRAPSGTHLLKGVEAAEAFKDVAGKAVSASLFTGRDSLAAIAPVATVDAPPLPAWRAEASCRCSSLRFRGASTGSDALESASSSRGLKMGSFIFARASPEVACRDLSRRRPGAPSTSAPNPTNQV